MDKMQVNGREVEFRTGDTIMEAAHGGGVEIPSLCHIPGLDSGGRCGVCVVELDSGELVHACTHRAAPGMRVRSESPAAVAARRAALEKLLLSGDHNCLVADMPPGGWVEMQSRVTAKPWHSVICPSWGDCRLQDLAIRYGVTARPPERPGPIRPLDDSHPMIVRDYARCIGCGRCAAVCNQVQVNMAIDTPGDDPDWLPSVDYDACTHCGQCVQACPVGALFDKKSFGLAKGHQAERVRTTCPYCGVGCQQELHVVDGRIVRVSGVEGAGPNQGRLCVKGRYGYDFIYSEERLTTPLIREGQRFREASWDEALDLVAGRFMEIKEKYGPDALAGVSCARSTNEDSYNMQKLFRAVIGTNNIDHCART